MFVITKDRLDGDCVGVIGPSSATLTAEQIRNHPERQRFRMRDGDDEVYYYGFFVPDQFSQDEFEPLDCFGKPAAGCIDIQYKVDGKWKSL